MRYLITKKQRFAMITEYSITTSYDAAPAAGRTLAAPTARSRIATPRHTDMQQYRWMVNTKDPLQDFSK